MSDVSLPNVVDRWEASGGTWRVVSVQSTSAAVELLRCDGGEVVERLTLRDAQDVSWARSQIDDSGIGTEGTLHE